MNDARTELAAIAGCLRAYLEWHADTGSEGLARGGREPRQALTAEVRPTAAAAVTPAATSVSLDRATPGADARVRLPELMREVASCTRCSLSASRTQTVFARGNPQASLCIVGEAPGAEEDAQGLPFVGRAGQLLDRMIGAMGL